MSYLITVQVSSVGKKEALEAIESAAKAFKTWKNHSAVDRRAIFLRAVPLLEQRKEEFIGIATEETTANPFWA